jgi:hypothetical protein
MTLDTNPLQAQPLRSHEALAQRIRNGEQVSLEELIAFIETTDKALTTERKVREAPTKPVDVDFF